MRRSLFALVIILSTTTAEAQIANRYDIVIDEIMADPTPQAGLPNNEWIELKNTSAVAFNLQGFRLADLTGQSGAMPSYLLKPDSFVIVCTGSAVTAMSAFGPTISVTSFPSLDNNGDQLSLISPQVRIIHALNYDISWYQNELKKDGGWTLEMIDSKNPCSGFTNWKAGIDLKGGTPGKKNSVDAANADKTSPKLLRAFAVDNLNITLVFDEPLDSTKGATAASYSISDGIGTPQSATSVAPVFDRVNLKLNTPLVANKVYTITANSVTDCAGNIIGSKNTARTGLSSVA
ncbi:MAG TPA: lamin tail domain-containing protein, partial [Chitinophagaceae bacterium]|nr:lamin tail domain-containing protein [Chitinophagaceae bacterium]